MVEIFAFKVDMASAEFTGEAVAVINRGGSALKFTPDAPEFVNKMCRMAYGVICFIDFCESLLEFGGEERAAVSTESAVGIGIVMEI
jgi:hypothetical protein